MNELKKVIENYKCGNGQIYEKDFSKMETEIWDYFESLIPDEEFFPKNSNPNNSEINMLAGSNYMRNKIFQKIKQARERRG